MAGAGKSGLADGACAILTCGPQFFIDTAGDGLALFIQCHEAGPRGVVQDHLRKIDTST